MIIMLFLALVLFIVYFIHTFHYSRHWMENFEVTLAFSENTPFRQERSVPFIVDRRSSAS